MTQQRMTSIPIEPVPVPKPRMAAARDLQLLEQVNNSWRLIAPVGVGKEELENPTYLDAVAGSLTDWDTVKVIIEDRSLVYECEVIQGGRDGLTGIGGGRARMKVKPGYPMEIPPIDRKANDGLPDGYEIAFDGFRGVHVPRWGTKALNPDGYRTRNEARDVILNHSKQAARATARVAI